MSSGRFWIFLVVFLLAGNTAALGILLVKSGDPGPRVMPDYYRRAIEWDQTVAALEASDELGWSVDAALAATEPARARLEVTVKTGAGAPVTGASVEAEVRHNSRAVGSATLFLQEVSPGQYQAVAPVELAGLHVVDVRARSGADHYVGSRTVELEAR